MNVALATIDKRNNSIKIPDDASYNDFECVLKDDCSILNPVIKFDLGVLTDPSSYNYASILDFGSRKYFITDWTFSNRLWIATLEIDVLGTYRSVIGDQTKLIARSASIVDTDVVDNLVQTRIGNTRATDSVSTSVSVRNLTESQTYFYDNFFTLNNGYDSGFFYVHVLYGNSTGYKIYQMEPFYYKALINYLYTFDYSSIASDMANIYKVITDPFQHILKVMWCPFRVTQNNEMTITKIGYVNMPTGTNAIRAYDVTAVTGVECTTTCSLSQHPGSAYVTGEWLNCAPYTRRFLRFQPFGNYDLTSPDLADDVTLTIKWLVDVKTGEAILTCYDEQGVPVVTDVGKYMCDVPIAQIKQSVESLIGNALEFAGSAIPDIAPTQSNNPANPYTNGTVSSKIAQTRETAVDSGSVIKSTLSTIGNVLSAYGTSFNSKGMSEALLPFGIRPEIISSFSALLPIDNEEVGRPVMQWHKLNTLYGFCQCVDGDIESGLTCTREERDLIATYLTNGFFLDWSN